MNKQTNTLAVLIVEDVESDAQLVIRLLKKAGYELVFEQVETAEQMRTALEKRTWDIVISDYKMPQFDGRAALQLLQDTGRDIPFIVVSGTIGEETAVSMMKAGAHDYLIKGDLGRFVPAVKRELEQAEIRREHRRAEKALVASESELRALFASMQDVVMVIDRQGLYRKIAPTQPSLLVKPAAELLGMYLRDVFPAEQAEVFIDVIGLVLDIKQTAHIEYELLIEGRTVYFETSISPMEEDCTLWVARDISERKQAEERLRESEEKHRAFIEQSSEGIMLVNEAGNIIEWNHAREALSGLKSEYVLGKPYWDIRWQLSPPDMQTADALQRFKSTTFEMLSGQSPIFNRVNEGRLVTLSGEIKNIEQVAFPIKTKNGYCVGSVMRDITARKLAEQALAASESELRALVEQVPTTIYTESAETRETLYISPQVEKLTGFTSAEWVEDHDLWKKIIHPTDVDAIVEENDRTSKSYQPFSVEYRILTRDGRTLWVHDEAVIIQNQDGTPLFWQGVMYDITERKQAEEALRESQSLYHSLVESSPLSICRKDPEGRFTFANRRFLELSNITLVDLLGKTDFDLHPPELAEKYQRDDQAVLANRQVQELIEDRAVLGGQPIIIQSIKTPIYDGAGKINGIQISFWDITERKQAEKLAAQQGEQLRLLYETSQRLNRTLDLGEIYQVICDFMSTIAPNDGVIISAFDHETQLITCRAYWLEDGWLDVRPFPSIPLEAEGKGTQSRVIRSGQAMLINDYVAYQKTASTVYYVDGETNEVNQEALPEEDVTRSALIVPLKSGGKVSGVIQVTSYRQNAYTENQLKLLESLALHIASAEQNALLYARVQAELNERKQAEKSLREREEQYRTLVEQLPAIVFIDDANVMGHTLYISPQIETILGFSQQEWLEKSPGVWMAQVHPDDHERVHAGYVRCFLSGEPHDAEYRIRTADGRMIWLRDQAVRLSDENGKPHLIHGVMYDITERKQSEEALRESEEKYRLIAENTSDGIILFDADSRIQYVSPSFGRQLGYETEEFNITPEGIYSFIHPDDHDLVFSDIYSAIELKKNGLTYSYRCKHKSGHYIWREDNAKFNYDDSGNYLGSHVICRDITERKLAEQAIRQRVTELEMLHQSGLALSRLLNPKEIGQKILELLKEKMGWHHTRIRLYSPQDDSLELLDFNQPGLSGETDRHEVVERYQSLITRSNQGMSGWVIQHGQTVRSGDVGNDPRYVEAYPGIYSGLYVPMKLGERVVGVISIEDEKPDAFSEADERLIATLANQAASAFENARLFDETRQRVMELETLNRISLVLRAVTKQNEMLSIVLDEALAILNTSHGSIELHNKTTDLLEQTILRGWIAQVTMPHHINEGIAGKVFTSGEIYVSREFATDPETRPASRSQIPPGWGGVCLPIRTTQQTLGVMIVSMPSEHELSKDEIRLLATLSEMTGAALQRMQLYEQTVRRLEQLHALRAVDQAIASNLDMRLTLDIVLSHVVSQLGVDAADVLLFHPDTNLLEFITGHGFHTILPESVRLNSSLAARAILERRIISAHNFEIVNKNPHFWNLWKEEGFVCYWCVPLIVKGEVKGVMEVYCRTDFTPDAEWLEFLDALTGQAAIAIDSTQLFENLQRANMDLSLAYDATIEGWSRAMDLRDHETEGHTLRVTDLTMKLARAMRVSESQLTAIRRGALLHDIGKMGVPDAILLKEGDLTDEEWVLMRKHPEFARDMLMPIAYLNDALNIPYCHHEKWDGTGYPQELKGDQIPLVARIFAIVDVWDALTNDRTYRTKWSKQKARQYIKEQSGKHFDPQVVDVFLNQVEND